MVNQPKVMGLPGGIDIKTTVIPSIVGVPRRNKHRNIGHTYVCFSEINTIQFHFLFPRPPEAASGGHFGWL